MSYPKIPICLNHLLHFRSLWVLFGCWAFLIVDASWVLGLKANIQGQNVYYESGTGSLVYKAHVAFVLYLRHMSQQSHPTTFLQSTDSIVRWNSGSLREHNASGKVPSKLLSNARNSLRFVRPAKVSGIVPVNILGR